MTAAIPQGNRRTQELALPAFTLWWREIVRFYRQRARVVGVIAKGQARVVPRAERVRKSRSCTGGQALA